MQDHVNIYEDRSTNIYTQTIRPTFMGFNERANACNCCAIHVLINPNKDLQVFLWGKWLQIPYP
jgi:hypothetical protein